jgi:hypothetical protein
MQIPNAIAIQKFIAFHIASPPHAVLQHLVVVGEIRRQAERNRKQAAALGA